MFIEPVFGKKFYGREEVLGTIQKRVTALKGGYRQNMALTGPMLSGKSSILRHFLNNINDDKIIPLYIEMTGEDFEVFCLRFMATLLYRYLKSEGRSPYSSHKDIARRKMSKDKRTEIYADLEVLKRECRGFIPDTTGCMDKIAASLRQKKNSSAYEKLLALTSVFKTETDKSCIVILDEFHNLASFRLKKPFQTFGKFIMVQKNTMYIVSSSQQTLLKDILSHKLSLLFGNFEILEVNGFDNQTARSFVMDKIKDVSSDDNIKNYLIQATQGNPFYLEVLANRMSELYSERGEGCDAKECLLDAFADLIYGSDGILNQYFNNNINFFLEKKARKKFIPILVALAHGSSTIKTIQEDMGKNDKELGKKLSKLQDMDLVLNSGIFYKVSDKLFEYWLKYVYDLKSRSTIDDMDIKYIEFKHLMEEDYKSYCGFAEHDATKHIADLFKNFRNEKIRISMNCRKMPQFDSVQTKRLGKTLFSITAKVGDKAWVCHIKQNDIADEHDVYGLWQMKNLSDGTKIVRKVFIPLKGIEQNAFLLSKEQNIWVWDAKFLNKMLRLFGQFEMVL